MVVFLLLAILVVLLIATGLWRNALALAGALVGAIVLLAATTSYGWKFWVPVLAISAACMALEVIKPLERLKRRQRAATEAQANREREQQQRRAVDDKAARKEAAIRAQVEATNNIGNQS